jgi:hypothetical protein
MEAKCVTCQRDLRKAKEKYTYLLTSGYNSKDAVRKILHDPNSALPPDRCCIVSIENDVPVKDPDVYKTIIDNQLHEKSIAAGKDYLYKKERFWLFPIDDSLTVEGQFVLDQSPFNDPSLLTLNTQAKGQEGYRVNNMTTIPEKIAASHNFETNNNTIMLWCGNIRVLPIFKNAAQMMPGIIVYQNATTFIRGQLNINDPSFLNCEILEYSQQPFQFNQTMGTNVPGPVRQVNAFLIEKVSPIDNPYN